MERVNSVQGSRKLKLGEEERLYSNSIVALCRCKYTLQDVRDGSGVDTAALYEGVNGKLRRCIRPKILIVHRNRLRAGAFAQMLIARGCEVIVCTNGHKAYSSYLRKNSAEFSLCICDWYMPGIAGRDLSYYESDAGGKLPFIALLSTGQRATDAIRSGADLFLKEPLFPHLRVILSLVLPLASQTAQIKLSAMTSNHDGVKKLLSGQQEVGQHSIDTTVLSDLVREDLATMSDFSTVDIGLQMLDAVIESIRVYSKAPTQVTSAASLTLETSQLQLPTSKRGKRGKKASFSGAAGKGADGAEAAVPGAAAVDNEAVAEALAAKDDQYRLLAKSFRNTMIILNKLRGALVQSQLENHELRENSQKATTQLEILRSQLRNFGQSVGNDGKLERLYLPRSLMRSPPPVNAEGSPIVVNGEEPFHRRVATDKEIEVSQFTKLELLRALKTAKVALTSGNEEMNEMTEELRRLKDYQIQIEEDVVSGGMAVHFHVGGMPLTGEDEDATGVPPIGAPPPTAPPRSPTASASRAAEGVSTTEEVAGAGDSSSTLKSVQSVRLAEDAIRLMLNKKKARQLGTVEALSKSVGLMGPKLQEEFFRQQAGKGSPRKKRRGSESDSANSDKSDVEKALNRHRRQRDLMERKFLAKSYMWLTHVNKSLEMQVMQSEDGRGLLMAKAKSIPPVPRCSEKQLVDPTNALDSLTNNIIELHNSIATEVNVFTAKMAAMFPSSNVNLVQLSTNVKNALQRFNASQQTQGLQLYVEGRIMRLLAEERADWQKERQDFERYKQQNPPSSRKMILDLKMNLRDSQMKRWREWFQQIDVKIRARYLRKWVLFLLQRQVNTKMSESIKIIEAECVQMSHKKMAEQYAFARKQSMDVISKQSQQKLEFEQLQVRYGRLSSLLEETTAQIQPLRKHVSELTEQVEALEMKNEMMTEQIRDKNDSILNLMQSNKPLEEELAKYKSESQQKDNKLLVLQAQLQNIQRKYNISGHAQENKLTQTAVSMQMAAEALDIKNVQRMSIRHSFVGFSGEEGGEPVALGRAQLRGKDSSRDGSAGNSHELDVNELSATLDYEGMGLEEGGGDGASLPTPQGITPKPNGTTPASGGAGKVVKRGSKICSMFSSSRKTSTTAGGPVVVSPGEMSLLSDAGALPTPPPSTGAGRKSSVSVAGGGKRLQQGVVTTPQQPQQGVASTPQQGVATTPQQPHQQEPAVMRSHSTQCTPATAEPLQPLPTQPNAQAILQSDVVIAAKPLMVDCGCGDELAVLPTPTAAQVAADVLHHIEPVLPHAKPLSGGQQSEEAVVNAHVDVPVSTSNTTDTNISTTSNSKRRASSKQKKEASATRSASPSSDSGDERPKATATEKKSSSRVKPSSKGSKVDDSGKAKQANPEGASDGAPHTTGKKKPQSTKRTTDNNSVAPRTEGASPEYDSSRSASDNDDDAPAQGKRSAPAVAQTKQRKNEEPATVDSTAKKQSSKGKKIPEEQPSKAVQQIVATDSPAHEAPLPGGKSFASKCVLIDVGVGEYWTSFKDAAVGDDRPSAPTPPPPLSSNVGPLSQEKEVIQAPSAPKHPMHTPQRPSPTPQKNGRDFVDRASSALQIPKPDHSDVGVQASLIVFLNGATSNVAGQPPTGMPPANAAQPRGSPNRASVAAESPQVKSLTSASGFGSTANLLSVPSAHSMSQRGDVSPKDGNLGSSGLGYDVLSTHLPRADFNDKSSWASPMKELRRRPSNQPEDSANNSAVSSLVDSARRMFDTLQIPQHDLVKGNDERDMIQQLKELMEVATSIMKGNSNHPIAAALAAANNNASSGNGVVLQSQSQPIGRHHSIALSGSKPNTPRKGSVALDRHPSLNIVDPSAILGGPAQYQVHSKHQGGKVLNGMVPVTPLTAGTLDSEKFAANNSAQPAELPPAASDSAPLTTRSFSKQKAASTVDAAHDDHSLHYPQHSSKHRISLHDLHEMAAQAALASHGPESLPPIAIVAGHGLRSATTSREGPRAAIAKEEQTEGQPTDRSKHVEEPLAPSRPPLDHDKKPNNSSSSVPPLPTLHSPYQKKEAQQGLTSMALDFRKPKQVAKGPKEGGGQAFAVHEDPNGGIRVEHPPPAGEKKQQSHRTEDRSPSPPAEAPFVSQKQVEKERKSAQANIAVMLQKEMLQSTSLSGNSGASPPTEGSKKKKSTQFLRSLQ